MTLNKPVKTKSINHLNQLIKSNYFIEPKLDGSRHILKYENNELKILRDSGREKNRVFPELTQIELPDNTILDGEVCYLKSDLVADFYQLLPRENLSNEVKINVLSKKYPLSFVAFDILKYQDKDLSELPYQKRHSILNELKVKDPFNRFKVIKQFTFNEFNKLDRTGMEGIVLKNPVSRYSEGWIKHKFYVESDFNVIGYTSETRLISALELVDQDNNYVGKVNYINYPQTKEYAQTLKGKIAVVIHQWTNKNKIKFPVLKELRSK